MNAAFRILTQPTTRTFISRRATLPQAIVCGRWICCAAQYAASSRKSLDRQHWARTRFIARSASPESSPTPPRTCPRTSASLLMHTPRASTPSLIHSTIRTCLQNSLSCSTNRATGRHKTLSESASCSPSTCRRLGNWTSCAHRWLRCRKTNATRYCRKLLRWM